MHNINFKRLKNWFIREQRDLPWRNSPSPYAVWVSEVMLQQTQVSVVIPYYERWMKRFPTIKDLAESHLDEVIKLWEGLGYYSRARSLHEGAQYVLKHHKGRLPSNAQDLSKIKGLGPYTVGAILSFAFHQRAAAVDGNVLRVLSRLFEIKEDIAKSKTMNQFRELAYQLLPEDESWIQNEALIELGATVCTKKAKCMECPLRSNCKAYANGTVDQLPYKSTKIATKYLFRAVPVILCGESMLVKRGEKGQIMSDLHEFPYFETDKEGWDQQTLTDKVTHEWSLSIEFVKDLPPVSHSFTSYQVKLNPFHFICKKMKPIKGYRWITKTELKELAFSSGHRKIFQTICD